MAVSLISRHTPTTLKFQLPLSFIVVPTPCGLRGEARKAPLRYASNRCRTYAKFNIDIVTLGKRTSKDTVYDSPIDEYKKRMRSILQLTERNVKREQSSRIIEAAREKGASIMILHSEGNLPEDSVHFAQLVFNMLDHGRGKVVIVIGDAEGLPDGLLRMRGPRVNVISLSTLTLTHKMVCYQTHHPFLIRF